MDAYVYVCVKNQHRFLSYIKYDFCSVYGANRPSLYNLDAVSYKALCDLKLWKKFWLKEMVDKQIFFIIFYYMKNVVF